ncbi:phosphoglycerate dehydrogenase-like enzyme [Paenarthrobacter nicotinovorans]|uniref:NAD(P)-dependent oxidoreductase n=1 Tax=Paenarthrobacter nicotinovorans TaxID=29320 RepID=UPI0027811147|nr:NAD(P)-dependent oxidoreductase [Paenarthrobacter nicotinovorans]MDP9936823.1 phosphoglycerate dehydrogenase-like enzyme [Paenarthrobacter nicotinovorans]
MPYLTTAISDAGGITVDIGNRPEGLVLDHGNEKAALLGILNATPSITWVQLPSAGIEAYASAITAHPDKTWTSAKGAYAKPVAEHALTLALALLRNLPDRLSATSWGQPSGISLHGLNALIIGAGGIALELLRLFKTFDMQVDIVRRNPVTVPGARRTTTPKALRELLPLADVVVLAAALTDDSRNLIGKAELRAMKREAILVNVARGGLVDTVALTEALIQRRIHGAGLDVTDPEPLPEGHPLWHEPRAIITPHTADTLEMVRPLLATRVRNNIRRFRTGQELEGLVCPQAGY